MIMQITAAISRAWHWLTKPLPKMDEEYKWLPLKRLNRFTQAYYNRYIRKIAGYGILYGMAEHTLDTGQLYGSLVNVTGGKVRPWPTKKLLHIIKMCGLNLAKSMDALIVLSLKPQEDRIFFRRTLEPEPLIVATNRIKTPFTDHQKRDGQDEDYEYFMCATTEDRLAYIRKMDEWQGRVEYAAYVDRARYETEVGRLKIGERKYIYFIKIGDKGDDVPQTLVFGADMKLEASNLKDNLRVVLSDIPTKGEPVKGVAVHYRMWFSARAEEGTYQVLRAQKKAKR